MQEGKFKSNPKITERIFEGGKIMGINFLDHIIISFKEHKFI